MTDLERPVAYWQVGNGPPVAAFGGVHCDHSYMRVGIEGLTDRATATYVDHRGTGASPPVWE